MLHKRFIFVIVLATFLVSVGFSLRSASGVGQPFVETLGVGRVFPNAAILQASINPNGLMTTAWFEFGTTSNLGQTTNSTSVGDSFVTTQFLGSLSNLVPSTAYFYRIVTQNQSGFQYGTILSFKTSATGATPTPTPSTNLGSTALPSATPPLGGEQDISCLVLTPALSPESPDHGQEFAYSIFDRNDCSADFTNVVLKVALPLDVTLKSANQTYSAEAGNNFSFNLGTVAKGSSSTLDIKGMVNDSANDGDTILFSSVLKLTDSNGKFRSVVSTLSDVVGKKGEVAGIADDISNALGDGGWWWLLFVILIVVLVFLVYILLSERSRRSKYGQRVTINTPPPPPPYYR